MEEIVLVFEMVWEKLDKYFYGENLMDYFIILLLSKFYFDKLLCFNIVIGIG